MASLQEGDNHDLAAVGVDMVGADTVGGDIVGEASCSDVGAADFCYSVHCNRGEGSSASPAKPVRIFH